MIFELISIFWISVQVNPSHSQVIECGYAPRSDSIPCELDITDWNAATSPYDCSGGPTYTLAQAAAGNRVRRDVYQLTDNATHEQELHDLLFALTCSINQGIH